MASTKDMGFGTLYNRTWVWVPPVHYVPKEKHFINRVQAIVQDLNVVQIYITVVLPATMVQTNPHFQGLQCYFQSNIAATQQFNCALVD